MDNLRFFLFKLLFFRDLTKKNHFIVENWQKIACWRIYFYYKIAISNFILSMFASRWDEKKMWRKMWMKIGCTAMFSSCEWFVSYFPLDICHIWISDGFWLVSDRFSYTFFSLFFYFIIRCDNSCILFTVLKWAKKREVGISECFEYNLCMPYNPFNIIAIKLN